MEKEAAAEAARHLLEQTRLRPDEVRGRFQQTLSPGYWKTLNPHLFVPKAAMCAADGAEAIDTRSQARLVEQFGREGYFQLAPLIPERVIEGMRRCVQALMAEDWPPVFAFVYDQFWEVPRIPALAGLLTALLEPTFRQTASFWTHYVAPVRGATGWEPHKDYPGQPGRLTLWIPLSDATLDNGCISVIPKNLTPARILDGWHQLQTFDRSEVVSLLQQSRALPAPAGSVLCWDGEVIHWGSVCTRAQMPRISFSLEFIARGQEPAAHERPVFDVCSTLPTFDQRLRVIGKLILGYQKNDSWMIRYADLARRLVEKGAAAQPG
jgi:hypothetical protein